MPFESNRDPSLPAREMTGAELDAARAALRKSEETLRLVFENAREYAIISTDLHCRITSWNPGAERLLGYAEPEILGQKAALIFTPEDRAAGLPEEEERRVLADGRTAHECWHQRRDGSRFWGSGVLTLMHDAHGQRQGYVKIFRDRTEERRMEAERTRTCAALQVALDEVGAASRAKDHFLSVLSHELRTPLTPVLLMIHTLSRRRDLPPEVLEALGVIERNVQTETRLIDELLDLTRLTHGKLAVVPAPMDLHEAARRAVAVCAPDLRAREQSLDLALDAPDARLHGDSARLQQVCWNLLQNASKFTPAGGAIRLASRQEGPGNIVVEITDTGIGIDPAALPRIFDPFEQADTSIARRFGGLGLGLAISRAVVEAHGGTLRASSPGPGLGTTFTLRLPVSAGTSPAV